MTHIILTEDQAKVVGSALQPVQVRDSKGNVLGIFSPTWSEEDIAEAKRRLASDEPRYSTAEVLSYLQSLERP